MKKNTIKILKLLLLMVVGCFLGGCVTNVSSKDMTKKDTAKYWGNQVANSDKKYGVLRVQISKRQCIYRQDDGELKANFPQVRIIRLGAFFSLPLLVKEEEKTKIGIRLIPYVINGETENQRVLVPNAKVDTFYPECYGNHQKIVSRFQKFYPIMLFKVDNEKNRNVLIDHLESLEGELGRHFDEINGKAATVGELLQKVFHSKQVEFLESLSFNVCVELIDEKNILKQQIKFPVMNDKTSPSPCNRVAITSNKPPKSNGSTITTSTEQKAEIDNLNNRIEVFKDAQERARTHVKSLEAKKSDLEDQIKSVRATLEEVIEKNRTALKAMSQYDTLKNIIKEEKLAQAIQKIFESYPEFLAVEQNKSSGYQGERNVANISKHKLIVISLSKFSKEQQRALQKSLIEILSTDSRSRFTLFTIQQGRQLYELLSSDELPLPTSGKNSIQGKIYRSMQFGASDLNALDDLSLVDFIIQEKAETKDAVGKVLYLTDNIRLYPNEKPPSKQRGVPLAWLEDGISLTILTTKECETWDSYMKAECHIWQHQHLLKQEIENFLQ